MDKSKLVKGKPLGKGQSPPERESFEKIVTGHKFEVVGTGVIKDYPKEAFWCAFCGGRGKNYVAIRRDDGRTYKVGKTCVENLGLVIPLSAEKDTSLVKVQAVEEEKKPKVKVKTYDPLQDEIEQLLKDL